jgi:DUF1680 family protein
LTFALHLRIPGWLTNDPALGNLYSYTDARKLSYGISVNGKPIAYNVEKGYAVIEQEWNTNDVVEVIFPMTARKMMARKELLNDRDRTAIQRGPLVYCVEGADNEGEVWNIVLPPDAVFTEKPHHVLSDSVVALETDVLAAIPSSDGKTIQLRRRRVTAIPYYAWANRGANSMQVWLPTRIKGVKINYNSKYEDGGND